MLAHVSDIEVGAELRRRRNELGLTLRQVSDLTDLTSGFLSQVENDLVSPSLKSLGRIAEVLRIPLFQLLSTNGGDPVVRSDKREIVPFVKMEAPFQEIKDLCEKIWDVWCEEGKAREVGES